MHCDNIQETKGGMILRTDAVGFGRAISPRPEKCKGPTQYN